MPASTSGPNFVYAYILRGFARGQSQEFAAAEADFDRGPASRTPMTTPPMPSSSIAVSSAPGRESSRKPSPTSSTPCALKPDQYQAYANLANVYQEKKDLAAAATGSGQGPRASLDGRPRPDRSLPRPWP